MPGPLLSAILALVGAGVLVGVVLGQRRHDPDAVRPVRPGRRLLGMLLDWLVTLTAGLAFAAVLGGVVALASAAEGPPPTVVDDVVRPVALGVLPALLQLVLILVRRRTIGERIVRLRPRPPTGAGGAVIRWALGIGGFTVLTLIAVLPHGSVGYLLAALLALATVGGVLRTRDHRGLAYAAAGWDLEDDRATPAGSSPR